MWVLGSRFVNSCKIWNFSQKEIGGKIATGNEGSFPLGLQILCTAGLVNVTWALWHKQPTLDSQKSSSTAARPLVDFFFNAAALKAHK